MTDSGGNLPADVPGPGASEDKKDPAGKTAMTSDSDAVEKTRARAGMFAVFASDIVIAVAAIWGVVDVTGSKNANATSVVSILSSAFTAVATLTTAYFGIKATANTAKAAVNK